MAALTLPCGYTTIVDDEDLPRIAGYRWCSYRPVGRNKTRYVCARRGARKLYLHRVILEAPYGVPVDHRSGDGLDNRKANLRLATSSLNNANKPITRNATGFRGVTLTKSDRFRARISEHPRATHLGSFATAHEAALAYDRAAILKFGEFAQLNFPLSEAA